MNEYTVTYAIGTSRNDVQNRQVTVTAKSASLAAVRVEATLPRKIAAWVGSGARAEILSVTRKGSLFAN